MRVAGDAQLRLGWGEIRLGACVVEIRMSENAAANHVRVPVGVLGSAVFPARVSLVGDSEIGRLVRGLDSADAYHSSEVSPAAE